jgi:hypothetical protein
MGRASCRAQRRERADRGREQHQHAEVAPAPAERQLVGARGRSDDRRRTTRAAERAIAEQRGAVVDVLEARRRLFVANGERQLHVALQVPSDRRDVAVQRIARLGQLAAAVEKQRRVETIALRRKPHRLVGRRREGTERFVDEKGPRLCGVGGELSVRPDGERDRRDHEEREQGE